MIFIVSGGSGSGKSEIAENKAIKLSNGKKLYYIATMKVFGDEEKLKIQKHRKMRDGKGFETIEKQLDIGEISVECENTVLLECMSNLVANEFFDEKCDRENLVEKITDDILNLSKKCENLVIVTNDVFCDGEEYDKETIKYMQTLANVNYNITKICCEHTEVVCGIEIIRKKVEQER